MTSFARAALFALLTPLASAQDRVQGERIPVLLITGANNHDWEWTAPELERTLEETGRFDVTVTSEPAETLADAAALEGFAAFVLDYNGDRWGEPAESNFLAAVRAGTGVAVIHAANNAFPGWREYEELVGLLWREGTGHGRFHAFDVVLRDRDHPVTAGMEDLFDHPDELYHGLVNCHDVDVHVLATAFSSEESGGSGQDEPMVLVHTFGEGRVFHTPLGHVWRNVPASRASHADPQFRRLVARGTEWAATGAVTLSPKPPNWLSRSEREAGFELLFDGRTTAGWRGYLQGTFPESGWDIDNGCLHHVAKGGGGDIVTEREFSDFELRFEWAVAPRANSGVIYRVAESEPASYQTGPEFQVLDDAAFGDRLGAVTSSGSLYALAPPTGKTLHPPLVFNEGRIVVRGWRVEHWVNGVKVVDCDLDDAEMKQRIASSKFVEMPKFATVTKGRIALQDHGDEVWYRSLRIRSLEPDDR